MECGHASYEVKEREASLVDITPSCKKRERLDGTYIYIESSVPPPTLLGKVQRSLSLISTFNLLHHIHGGSSLDSIMKKIEEIALEQKLIAGRLPDITV